MADDTECLPPTSLEVLLRPWPIALSLCSHLTVGDLISLARSSSALRASFHGFGAADPLPDPTYGSHIRDSIYVGLHGTPYWQRLKDATHQTCSSKTHTKGDKVHSCRMCSRLICEACIVRSSFARGKEDTFRNRCRFFCQECWDNGNISRSRRHPLHLSQQLSSWHGDSQSGPHDEVSCTCTLKENGWLCLECKDVQNYEAASRDRLKCHGLGCLNDVGADYERRRVCLWCNKNLPRHIGSTSRQVWNQKIIEARTRNAMSRQADLEEYNKRRLKMMRMSRREMRGDDAVRDDSDADVPQFVRHLDSCCNYRNFISERCVPDGNSVYNSKRGYWTYSRDFLVEIGERCERSNQLRRKHQVTALTWPGTSIFARTNRQCHREREYLAVCGRRDRQDNIIELLGEKVEPAISAERASRWVVLKARIMNLAFIERLEFFQIQASLQLDYNFDLPWNEFKFMLNVWRLTPLWEDTEIGQSQSQGPETFHVKKLELVKGDYAVPARMEKRIDDNAARVVERLVLAGYVLPLRTNATTRIEASHWVEEAEVDEHTRHGNDVHRQPLSEEPSDNEDISPREAAHAKLTGRFRLSMGGPAWPRKDLSAQGTFDRPHTPVDEDDDESQPARLRRYATAPTTAAQADSDRRASANSTHDDDVFLLDDNDDDDDDDDDDTVSFHSLPSEGANDKDIAGSLPAAADSGDEGWEVVPRAPDTTTHDGGRY